MSGRGRYTGKYTIKNDNYSGGGGSSYSQHDDRTGPINRGRGGRGRSSRGGRGNYQGNSYRGNQSRYGNRGGRGGRYNRGRGSRGQGREPYSSRYNRDEDNSQEDEDGDVNMEGDAKPNRFNPYARPTRPSANNRRPNTQRQPRENWYQITIIDGEHIDGEWLHQELQTVNSIQYQPVQYHIDDKNASFFLNDRSAAESIASCSKKLTSPDGAKVMILMRPAIQSPITEGQIPKLKEILSSRYKVSEQHLNCSALGFDQNLKAERIFIRLNEPSHMHVVAQIIAQHISSLVSLDLSDNRIMRLQGLAQLTKHTPNLKKLNLAKNQIKHVKEFEPLRHCDLVELTLDRNPICGNYESQSSYISDIREYFPNVLKLDGQELPAPVKFDVENEVLPKPEPHFLPSNGLDVIKNFVETYFKCFDSSRSDLAEAYHEDALFTLSVPTSPRGPSLRNYFDFSRNLRTIKKNSLKVSTVVSKRGKIIAKLEKLPKTTHHFHLFCIDVPLATSPIVNFIIRGTFKEAGQYGSIRAFSRSFICQVTSNGLQIINEQYSLRNAVATELADVKKIKPSKPAPQPQTKLMSNKPPNYAEMITAFAKESGMNFSYSEQCLEENGWDYGKAGQTFLQLKEQGKIPPEAFAA